jgi:formylglycine-generating enzyme required for sulfatase activity/tetratricopeptide (TPR) repeat protein
MGCITSPIRLKLPLHLRGKKNMPLPTLIQSGFSTLLDDIVISDATAQKAILVFKEHFTFSADEITKAYQDSYGYAITAISVGLSAPDQKLAFLQKFRHSKITREFADPIEINYFQPFAQQRGVESEILLRKQLISELNQIAKHKDQLFQIKQITQEDLTALITHKGSVAITELVLEQIQLITPVDDTLAAFLSQDDLLGKALLYFFHEIIRRDQRVEKTQAALQREGLSIEVRELQTALKTAQDNLNQAIAEQSTELVEIAQQLQDLRQAQSARQSRSQLLTPFPAWADLLNCQLDHLLDFVTQISELHQDVIKTKDLAEEILQILKALMARQDLSSRVKARDEFTRHNSKSLNQIHSVVTQFKQLSSQNPKYSQLSIMVGSALSSTGDLLEAEAFFRKAIKNSHNSAQKGLAYFNLFQVQLRRGAYADALENLQTAIKLDPQQYILHDIRRYPLEKLLGAGGMGCAFLCENQNRLIPDKWVVVKCFWENLLGTIDEVFKEPISMHQVAGDYVPKPLDYGYADVLNQERAYFVTEYVEGAIDGETWLKKYGQMDLKTALRVGLQIAKGLEMAHQKGIYHLDLKPANILLLKKTSEVSKTSDVSVKIIDFGLSQVAPSLVVESGQNKKGLSGFGQAIFGTWDYAPPEQQGAMEYGKPSASSDVYAFGGTLYRFLTGLSPRYFSSRKLPQVPALQDLLFDCVEEEPSHRPSSAELRSQLEAIETSQDERRQAELAAEQKRQTELAELLSRLEAQEAEQKRQAELAAQEAERRRKAELAAQEAEQKQQTEIAELFSRLEAIEASQAERRQAELAAQKTEQKQQTEIAKLLSRLEAIEASQAEIAREKAEGKLLDFNIVTVNAKGKITERLRKEARYLMEKLGKGVLLQMVSIPGGTFMMGSPETEEGRDSDEGPQHQVTVEPFYMGKYPVTQAQWEAVMGNNPSKFKGKNRPVEKVSWNEAVEFCKRLSEMMGKTYRLPSEAQWEYACRAGTTTPFYFGETITTDIANYDGNSTYAEGPKGVYRKETTEVGSFPPNAFGLYDMHGNIWEWCADSWHDSYEGAPNDGSVWEGSSGRRVLRGGSWVHNPRNARSANIGRNTSGERVGVYGFRVVSSVAWT